MTLTKEELITKHLGCNMPQWIIDKCITILDEYETSLGMSLVNNQTNTETSTLGAVMCCFQCGDNITPYNNGISINNGEFFQCDDCHYNEWGYNINVNLLVFKKPAINQ